MTNKEFDAVSYEPLQIKKRRKDQTRSIIRANAVTADAADGTIDSPFALFLLLGALLSKRVILHGWGGSFLDLVSVPLSRAQFVPCDIVSATKT